MYKHIEIIVFLCYTVGIYEKGAKFYEQNTSKASKSFVADNEN